MALHRCAEFPLTNRRHDCDLLLDQNFFQNLDSRKLVYKGLVAEKCRLLLGPQYAVLRGEFLEARKTSKVRTGSIHQVLVSFGGVDATQETLKVLRAFKMLKNPEIAVDIVIGALNSNRLEIEETAASLPHARCHFDVKNMAELMLTADVFVGACGATTWERCCLGLPSFILAVAENQVPISHALGVAQVQVDLGPASGVTTEDLFRVISQ